MSVSLRCSPVPREMRKKTGVTVSRAIICHPAVAAAGGRRADCCSSLSPISDCFFKAPVAEDINYPASVNHVIYRPRPRGPRGDDGTEGEYDGGRGRGGGGGGGGVGGGGWGRGGRGNGGEDRGGVRIRRGSCCTMRWCCIAASRSKMPVDRSPRPQQYPARRSRNLSATRPKLSSRPVAARLTARRGRPHLPRRSIDLPPPGSRANPRSWMLAAPLRNTFFGRWLIHLAPRQQGHWDNVILFNSVTQYVVHVVTKQRPLICKTILAVFFSVNNLGFAVEAVMIQICNTNANSQKKGGIDKIVIYYQFH